MNLLLFLLLNELPPISVSMNASYITQVKELIGLPVTAVFLKPTIQYGDKWGVFADNLYASMDCVDATVEAKLGLNCFNIAGFYGVEFNPVHITAGLGILRIDIAGIIDGSFQEQQFADILDEDRTGIYGSIRAKFDPIHMFRIKTSVGTGIVTDGKFWEIGASCMFRLFRNLADGDETFKNNIFLSMGVSFMKLEATLKEMDRTYSTFLGNYLVGIAYER